MIRDFSSIASRMFHALKRVKDWVPVDGYYDMGPGPRISRQEQERDIHSANA